METQIDKEQLLTFDFKQDNRILFFLLFQKYTSYHDYSYKKDKNNVEYLDEIIHLYFLNTCLVLKLYNWRKEITLFKKEIFNFDEVKYKKRKRYEFIIYSRRKNS